MDEVIAMFQQDTADAETRVTEVVRRLVTRARPELSARLATTGASPYTDPLVLAYFHGANDPGITLDQLLVGHMEPRARPTQIQIRTDVNGTAELPGIGVLKTSHRVAEMVLDDQLTVSMDGHVISARLDQQPRVRFEHEPLLDCSVAPPLRFILGRTPGDSLGAPAGDVGSDLRRACEILERVQPEFAELMNRTTRRIVVFDQSDMNSLAAPRAHGSVFLNLAHGCGAIYHLEDLLHQCGHVAFQAMTMDPASVLSVDPDTALGDPDESAEPRTAYVVFHAVVTERWMVRGLLACLRRERLTSVERAEARGRLAYILRRYVLDLVDLTDADVTTPRGTALLQQLLADLRTLHGVAQPYISKLDMSGQPYNFNMAAFVERNPGLIDDVP